MGSPPQWLGALQQSAYACLAESDAPCFLRRSQDDAFLFVTDLPRHVEEARWQPLLPQLARAGFLCRPDPSRGLLNLDAELAAYEALLASLPLAPPPFPPSDALHAAYALCRLLLLHPAPLAHQPLGPLRHLLKQWAGGSPALVLRAVFPLREAAAGLLREKQPLPHAAGQLLSAWLAQRAGTQKI